MDQVTITTKWALQQNTFTESDYLWCKGFGITAAVVPLYNTVHISGSVEKQMSAGVSIRLLTTCEKQENMLKLKYGEKAYPIQQWQSIGPIEIKQLDF